jgi:hypothetical protein
MLNVALFHIVLFFSVENGDIKNHFTQVLSNIDEVNHFCNRREEKMQQFQSMRFTSSKTFLKDVLGAQPWHLSIFGERVENKGAPCWIRTNNLLTAVEVLLPAML